MHSAVSIVVGFQYGAFPAKARNLARADSDIMQLVIFVVFTAKSAQHLLLYSKIIKIRDVAVTAVS